MLQTLQRSFIWFDSNFKALNLIFEVFNQSSKILLFLVTPEDSTETAGRKGIQSKNPGEYNIHGGIKALFWVVMSIILACLIGQLH